MTVKLTASSTVDLVGEVVRRGLVPVDTSSSEVRGSWSGDASVGREQQENEPYRRSNHGQCLRERAGTIDDVRLVWEDGKEAEIQCTLSVVAESRPQKPLGRSPDSEGASAETPAGRFAFPGC